MRGHILSHTRYYALLIGLLLVSDAALAQPAISVSPMSHNYGSVDVGQSRLQTFRIRNTGSDTLEAVVGFQFGTHFTLSTDDSVSVLPGGFHDALVSFAPVRPGTSFDSLLVIHNAGNAESPIKAALTGTGLPVPEISVNPATFDFDTVAVRTSQDGVFWIGNPGSGQVTVRASIGQGSPVYVVQTTTELFTVASGDSVPVIVRFEPQVIGRRDGQLRIDHNGRNRSTPINIPMSGVGAQAVTLDPFEPNDSASVATPVDPGFLSDSTEIWPSGDVDYYAYQGVYGEFVSIRVEIPDGSTLNGRVWLYDPDGNLLTDNDNFNGDNNLSQIEDTLMASGTHYIRVAFAGNNAAFPGDAASKSAGEDPIGEYRLVVNRTGNLPLGTPELVMPDDNVFDERVDPTLAWGSVAGAKVYDVVVASRDDFGAGTIAFQSTRTDTSVVAPGLPAGMVLYWRVRAGYELGSGGFSVTRQFQTTFAPVVVSSIEDLLLAEGSVDVDLSPVFSDPEGGELTYRVVSFSDSAIVEAVVSGAQLTVTQVGDGSTTVTVAGMDPKGAEAQTSFGVIAGAATATSEDGIPPIDFGLGTNFPNPFVGETSIPFAIVERSEVELEVFDVLGSRVRTLVRDNMGAGEHSVVLRTDDLAPGVYLVRLRAGQDADVSRIIVGR